MKKESYTVHEHIVPVCYLKFFANPENDKVHRYDKQHHDIKYKSPKTIGYEDDFYEIYKDSKGKREYCSRNTIEDVLGKIEHKFRETFYDIVKAEDISNMQEEEKEILSDYISVQFARTKKQHLIMSDLLEFFMEDINKLSEHGKKLILQNALFAGKSDTDVENYASLRDLIYNWLTNNSKFIFIQNSTNILFYTCDNPVLIFDESDNLSIDALYIPLSPTFALWVMDKEISTQYKDVDIQHIEKDGVLFFNELICNNADRYIISRKFTDADKNFLKQCGYELKKIGKDDEKHN